MNLNKKLCGYWVLLLLASIILLNGCKTADLMSKWRDKDIVIDASDSEWQDARQYYDAKTQTSIGIYNDDDNLYMCMTTSDAEILTAFIRQGFIVWFNNKGSKAKELGVRFPIIDQAGPGGPAGQGAPPGGDSISVAELKILTSAKDEGKMLKIAEAAQLGVSARINIVNNKLIYELKMPLKKTDKTPYAAVPSATNNLGVGFMLYSKATRSASGISGFGGAGGDMSSGSGGGGGGGGGGRGMDSRDGGFSVRDVSSMSNIFSFFSMSDDDISSMSDDDVSVINAQPGGGAPPGGGGGMGGGGMGGDDDMGGDDMGGSMGGAQSQTRLEVWFNLLLATK